MKHYQFLLLLLLFIIIACVENYLSGNYQTILVAA